VHASLRLDERVEFVHDYEPHMDEILREGSLSHEHLERLGRDHQDVGGLPLVPRAVTLGTSPCQTFRSSPVGIQKERNRSS